MATKKTPAVPKETPLIVILPKRYPRTVTKNTPAKNADILYIFVYSAPAFALEITL